MMNEVFNIISCKDLDYLSDMFSWNYVLCKKANYYASLVSDDSIKDKLKEVCSTCNNNLELILNIINERGNYE